MNFSRKMIIVVGAALLAACGDKVTVAGPSTPVTPTPKINGVEVAPASATLTVGQSITMTAAVNADVGLATTVTWSSSDATKASVSSAGVVLAVAATPGVAICAASTVDTGKKGCASVIVQAATAVIPASISIQSITFGALNTPVNPLAVKNQIDVTLNVNPGNQVITKVELLVGGIVAGSQTFTAAQAAALRFSADEAVAAQTTFPQIVFSVNTAEYNTTTGIPKWLNGARAISARLYTTAGGTATAASASATQTLTFANDDGFHVTTTLPTGNVVDGAGYRWNGNGSLTVGALPVMYSGTAIGTVNATLGANPSTSVLNTCLAGPAPTLANNTAAATTATAGVYSIVLPMTANQSPAGCTAAWPNMLAISATSAAGDNLALAATGVLNTQLGWRWDNIAPAGVPTFLANPNGRSAGWINDAVVFNALNAATTATINNWLVNVASVDAGVGGVAYAVRAAASATGTVAEARAAADVTSATALPRTATNITDCAIAYALDALGNRTASPAATSLCAATGQSIFFGVDKDRPVASFGAGSMIANFAGAALTQYRIVHFDTGLVGNSGFQTATAANRATVTISKRTANTAATAFVPNAATIVTVANVADTLVIDPSNAAASGYYTTTIAVKDNAGNAAGDLSRVSLRDAVLPTLLVPTQANIALTGGASQTFTSTGTDDNDLGTALATLPFASVGSGPFLVASTTLNTYNTLPAVVSTSVSVTIPFFVRGMQTIGALADSATVNAMAAPGNLTVTLFDMALNPLAQPYALQNVEAFTAYTALQISKLWMSGTGSISDGSGASANPTSRTFVLKQNGPIVATPLFSRVELFRFDGTVGAYRSAGITTAPSAVVDNGAVRTTSYSVSFTPGTAWTAGAANMLMVGYNATGDAVTIFTPIAVTITAP